MVRCRMIHRGIAASLVLLGVLPPLSGAGAQAICGTRAALTESLERRYAEEPVSIGVDRDGAVVEVFAAPSGTWTILVTRSTGVSCLLSSGSDWQSRHEKSLAATN